MQNQVRTFRITGVIALFLEPILSNVVSVVFNGFCGHFERQKTDKKRFFLLFLQNAKCI